jgi:hypothetical protein
VTQGREKPGEHGEKRGTVRENVTDFSSADFGAQGSSLARVRAGCRRRSACPSPSLSSGGRNRTCVPPVNSRALVPARTPPESSRPTVGMAGFEPALSCSRSRRICQAFPHPDSSRSLTSAKRESNPHVRHGKAVGYRYIMGTIAISRIVKEPDVLPVELRSRFSSRVGPEGVEPSSSGYQPSVLPLNYRPLLITILLGRRRGS